MSEIQENLRRALEAAFGERLVRAGDLAWAGAALCFYVSVEDVLEVMGTLKGSPEFSFDMLMDVTAVDRPEQKGERFTVVYHLLSLVHQHRLVLKVRLSEEVPEVESLTSLWAAAGFLEREVYDMFGIVFKNHGDLRRVLLYDEFVGHPLRKDYPLRQKQPRIPLRIPELHNSSMDMNRPALGCLQAKVKGLQG